MTTTVKNFIGIPVDMDELHHGRGRATEQLGQEEFRELITPVLEAGVSVRWDQYTPYFNDGDVCEFTIYSPRFHTDDIDEDSDQGEYDDGYVFLYDVRIEGGEEVKHQEERVLDSNRWNGYRMVYSEVKTGRVFDKHPAYHAMKEFSHAMDQGKFESLLYETFGDHALITVSADGIVKEFYDHE